MKHKIREYAKSLDVDDVGFAAVADYNSPRSPKIETIEDVGQQGLLDDVSGKLHWFSLFLLSVLCFLSPRLLTKSTDQVPRGDVPLFHTDQLCIFTSRQQTQRRLSEWHFRSRSGSSLNISISTSILPAPQGRCS